MRTLSTMAMTCYARQARNKSLSKIRRKAWAMKRKNRFLKWVRFSCKEHNQPQTKPKMKGWLTSSSANLKSNSHSTKIKSSQLQLQRSNPCHPRKWWVKMPCQTCNFFCLPTSKEQLKTIEISGNGKLFHAVLNSPLNTSTMYRRKP